MIETKKRPYGQTNILSYLPPGVAFSWKKFRHRAIKMKKRVRGMKP